TNGQLRNLNVEHHGVTRDHRLGLGHHAKQRY
ncbi:MAG: hypothetical protein JWR78_2649, partial [Mycobacterium sp.]|nr:hypothetical protein [Mycobacterium sp.]